MTCSLSNPPIITPTLRLGPVGSSGAEDSAPAHLTSALSSPPVNAPTLQFCPIGSSGATGLSPRGLPQCTPLLRRLCLGLSDAHRILRCSLHRFIWCNLPTGLAQGLPIAPTPLRRFIRRRPDAPVPLHRIIRCYWELQNSSISFFFEFFLRVLLCLAFLLHPWDLLIFT